MKEYSSKFFSNITSGASKSAAILAPLLIDLIKPQSVVDVGCGMGEWLAAFQEHGVQDILGLDGDWVDANRLAIPRECFLPTDVTKPIQLKRRFDLSISLEVGEHLDAAFATTFIDSLTGLSPIVVFSAAIPWQGGAHHVNEQWPAYWAKLFNERGFLTIDCLRDKIWNNPDVEYWYAQNMLIFAQKQAIDANPELQSALQRSRPEALALVHPRLFESIAAPPLRMLPKVLRKTIAKSIHRKLKK